MSTTNNRLSLADVESLQKMTENDSRFTKVATDPEWVRNLTALAEAQAEYIRAQTRLAQQEATVYTVANKFYPNAIVTEAKFT